MPRAIGATLLFLATFIALVFLIPLFAWLIGIRDLLPVGLASELVQMGYAKESIFYLKNHDVYVSFGWVMLCVAAAASLALILVGHRISKIKHLLLVFVPLILAIPLSATNFAYGDAFSTRTIQSIINLPIIFLSAVAV